MVGPFEFLTVLSSEMVPRLVAFLRLRDSFDWSAVGRSGSRRGLLERLRRSGDTLGEKGGREKEGGRREGGRDKGEGERRREGGRDKGEGERRREGERGDEGGRRVQRGKEGRMGEGNVYQHNVLVCCSPDPRTSWFAHSWKGL